MVEIEEIERLAQALQAIAIVTQANRVSIVGVAIGGHNTFFDAPSFEESVMHYPKFEVASCRSEGN
jgi:hypothetical protein